MTEYITIAGVAMTTILAQKLTDFNLSNLDKYENQFYNTYFRHGKEYVLQAIINQVEGDFSQLSKNLKQIAEAQEEI